MAHWRLVFVGMNRAAAMRFYRICDAGSVTFKVKSSFHGNAGHLVTPAVPDPVCLRHRHRPSFSVSLLSSVRVRRLLARCFCHCGNSAPAIPQQDRSFMPGFLYVQRCHQQVCSSAQPVALLHIWVTITGVAVNFQ